MAVAGALASIGLSIGPGILSKVINVRFGVAKRSNARFPLAFALMKPLVFVPPPTAILEGVAKNIAKPIKEARAAGERPRLIDVGTSVVNGQRDLLQSHMNIVIEEFNKPTETKRAFRTLADSIRDATTERKPIGQDRPLLTIIQDRRNGGGFLGARFIKQPLLAPSKK